MKQVFVGDKRVHVDRHSGRLRERVPSLSYFESLTWDIYFGSPLANYLALPGSESVFGLTKGPLLKFSSVVISSMNRFPLFF